VGAVVVVLVTAGIVASDLAALHRRTRDFGPERTALVARRDLQIGTTIDAADLRPRSVHTSQLPPGVLDDARHAVGRVVRVPVLRDGFVAARNLAPRRRSGLDGAIPAGMRALRIVVSDAVRPRVGAAVDVLASAESDAFVSTLDTSLDTSSDVPANAAAVVAHGVLVLGVGAARSADGAPARGVTLLVTPRQARELVFATTHEVVTLSLVPPEDARTEG
jgi:Flp pilus assembly protein CpaB